MNLTLTKAQARALGALERLLATNPAPSLDEWAQVAGADGQPITLAALMPHRAVLVALGLVAKKPGKTRSTYVTDLGRSYLRNNR